MRDLVPFNCSKMSDFSDPDDEVTEIRRVMVNYLGKLQQRTPNMTVL